MGQAMHAEITMTKPDKYTRTHSKGLSIKVRYTCFRSGISLVMVTVHILEHEPLDLAWRKRCAEPKVSQRTVLTAPQAMFAAMTFLGFVVFVVVVVRCACSDSEPGK